MVYVNNKGVVASLHKKKTSCSLVVITPMDAQQMGTPGGVTPDLHQRVADQPKKSGVESSSLPFCSDLGSLEREIGTTHGDLPFETP